MSAGQAAGALPDQRGYFGEFGGAFVPETLVAPLAQLEAAYLEAWADPQFAGDLAAYLRTYVGRPTPLHFARRLSERASGARIYLKREDLCHTGSHKLNNTIGQLLLTVRMGKRRVIAETGAGQHGVATATAAALFGIPCEVYMGSVDVRRQASNVVRMQLLGAKVTPVAAGSQTLKDAINEALRDWVATVEYTHYVLGSVVGPHPFPMMVRDFQSVIGTETREQCLTDLGRLPDAVVACVGGGSNALGIFYAFLPDLEVQLVGVEAGGRGMGPGQHAAPLAAGQRGVLHGSLSYLLQDDDGQVLPTHSVSAGLDYPGVGPEHAYLKDTGRARYVTASDDEALEAFHLLSECEGIMPALESAHAIAYATNLASQMPKDAVVVVCLSGRGDKDLEIVAQSNPR